MAGHHCALTVVDMQRDFLDRPGLVPEESSLCRSLERLLAAFREHGLPVVHVHTLVRADGSDRMPHWQAAGFSACVEGTAGALPPPSVAPTGDEPVVHKQFFSGFSAPTLDIWLREHGVDRVVIGGVFLHGCVRATALDAYQRGYEVWIADDAVGTTDVVHGAVSRRWLEGRVARFATVEEIEADLPELGVVRAKDRAKPDARAPEGVRAAASAAAEAQKAWGRSSIEDRLALLDRWAAVLASEAAELAERIVDEVAKPRKAADDEVQRAIAHVRSAAALLRGPFARPRLVADGVGVHHRPVGVVGLVQPWNNPLALPVGKLAPALAFGNGAVLKPAPEGAGVALALAETLARADVPTDLVGVVQGGREVAEALCGDRDVDALSVTGSVATGGNVAARCAATGKPVQAELGGNNAAIVLADADLAEVVPGLVASAFAFAGQRCTAIRRFVVEASVATRFEALAADAVERLVVGDPHDPHTDLGPLISLAARDRVLAAIDDACAGGARLVVGGDVPDGRDDGAWMAPTLLADVDPASPIAQHETFGPVAVLLTARDLDDALRIANGVEHGLVLSVCTADDQARRRVVQEAQAGIVQVGAGPLPVHPDAPFGGWKASGMGPPEHGEWDAAFYSRPQAVYGAGSC